MGARRTILLLAVLAMVALLANRARRAIRLPSPDAGAGAGGSADTSTADGGQRALIESLAAVIHIGHAARLLGRAPVQEALGLSAEQVRQGHVLAREVESTFVAVTLLSAQQRETKLRGTWPGVAATYARRIRDLLSPTQRRQLTTAVFQRQQGAIALLAPEAIARLKLTEVQRDQISALVAETQRAIDGAGPLVLLKLGRLARQARARAEDVLTPRQRATWAALHGRGPVGQ